MKIVERQITVTKYETSDGKLFSSESKAKDHEIELTAKDIESRSEFRNLDYLRGTIFSTNSYNEFKDYCIFMTDIIGYVFKDKDNIKNISDIYKLSDDKLYFFWNWDSCYVDIISKEECLSLIKANNIFEVLNDRE